MDYPQWRAFQLALEALWDREAQILTRPGLTYEEWLHQQALVHAIREVALLPHTIIEYERHAAHDRTERRARDERDPLAAVRHTPWYPRSDTEWTAIFPAPGMESGNGRPGVGSREDRP